MIGKSQPSVNSAIKKLVKDGYMQTDGTYYWLSSGVIEVVKGDQKTNQSSKKRSGNRSQVIRKLIESDQEADHNIINNKIKNYINTPTPTEGTEKELVKSTNHVYLTKGEKLKIQEHFETTFGDDSVEALQIALGRLDDWLDGKEKEQKRTNRSDFKRLKSWPMKEAMEVLSKKYHYKAAKQREERAYAR